MQETFKIKELEQIRLLSDPLKLRLLQAFAEGEKTTKQLAAELGESVTRLYRHVDALHDAGLIQIARETQKRGTVERTFRAVAQRFEADHSLFTGESSGKSTDAVRDLLQAGEAEILDALADIDTEKDLDEIIVTRFRVKGSPERIAELRQSLAEWLESVSACDAESPRGDEEAGGMIAFYPIKGER